MGIIDRITPEGQRFYAELAQLDKLEVRIGFQAGEASSEDGVDICDIAAWNEMGTEHTPARPFMRQTVDNNEDKIMSFCANQAKSIGSGGSAQDVYKKIGVFGKGLVQQTIDSGNFAPNAPSTIRKKGSAKPLIDTGQMRQSVNYVIKAKGSG